MRTRALTGDDDMFRKIIDLKRSEWDEKKSDRKKGLYDFKKIVYYKNKDFRDGYIHPYKLKWCMYSEKEYPRPFATLDEWKVKYKHAMTEVDIKDDYVPEGVRPNANGHYIDGDLILVKIPIELHMAERKQAWELSERQASGMKKAFQSDMRREGADIPDQWTEDRADRTRREIEDIGV
jgi:hypothetical protein